MSFFSDTFKKGENMAQAAGKRFPSAVGNAMFATAVAGGGLAAAMAAIGAAPVMVGLVGVAAVGHFLGGLELNDQKQKAIQSREAWNKEWDKRQSNAMKP